eukprot:10173898-Alexandrium_andersonii.AAC.1
MANAVRLATAVEGLAAGRPPPRHEVPGLQALLGTYAGARSWVRRGGWEVPDQPFPPDVHRILTERLPDTQLRAALAPRD